VDIPQAPLEDVLERVRGSISPEEVRAQVERICRSKAFENQGTSQKMLSYLTTSAIERHLPTPKQIAREVLGKKNFNPKIDGAVRVAMTNLRRDLGEYYDTEADENDIFLDIPKRQYGVFWRHSPKTLLGQTEFGGWVLSSSKLTAEWAQVAAKTSQKFWPHLATVFPIYCTEDFPATLAKGKMTLPDSVKMFFDSLSNYHLFITSFDRSQIRIYPLNVWLDEWARVKSSEEGPNSLNVYEYWGRSAEIENKAEISIHPKLLNALNVPENEPFDTKLFFHPEGFIYFDVPKPAPRPTGKYNLYCLTQTLSETDICYYYILVNLENDESFNKALAGTTPFNPKIYGTVIASGPGEPPEGMSERLLAKYEPVLAKRVTELSPPPGS
jgi:hypothetical protein